MYNNKLTLLIDAERDNSFKQNLFAMLGWFLFLGLTLSIGLFRVSQLSISERLDFLAVNISESEQWLAKHGLMHGRIYDPAAQGFRFIYEDGTIAADMLVDGVYYRNDGIAASGEWINNTYYDESGYPFSYDGSLGTKGRLYIPELDISVALYDVPESQIDAMGQKIIDAEDSAAWMYRPINHGDTPMVGDHSGQAFYPLLHCPEGVRAVIKTEEELTLYICYTVDTDSVNIGKTIVDSQGRDITEDYDSDGFVCYTCNDRSGRSVTIAAFREDAAMG